MKNMGILPTFYVLMLATVLYASITLSAPAPLKLPPFPTPPSPKSFTQEPVTQEARSGLEGLGAQSLLASVRLLIESHSIELLVDQLAGLSPQSIMTFLKECIRQPRAMDADEVTQVGYGLMMPLIRGKKMDEAFVILDLLATAPELQERPPLLIIAAHSSYPQAITLLLLWAQQHNKLYPLIQDALTVLAHTFDVQMLKKLEKYGVTMTPERATFMLWQAIQTPVVPEYVENYDDRQSYAAHRTAFIDYLLEKKANVNYQESGYSLLMKAAHNNDPGALEQLLKAGADANLIINDTIGSALQLAIAADAIDAELMLRKYNAHE